MALGDGVDEGVEVEGWKVRVFCLDEQDILVVIPLMRVESIFYNLVSIGIIFRFRTIKIFIQLFLIVYRTIYLFIL